MNLFHGSIETIEHPKIFEQQRLLDFGRGFYLTSNVEQAERWASIKMKRTGGKTRAIVNKYGMADELLNDTKLKIKIFTSANEDWLMDMIW